jgi:glycosyltransferase involved in cell wall biosynthesis
MIAYTSYAHDARVRRHAEALAQRGDEIDVICLGGRPAAGFKGVNVIEVPVARYRGASRRRYLGSYLRFFSRAAAIAARRAWARPYDVVIVCTMPDAAVLCALGPRLLGSKVLLDIHDTMPELYRDKFSGAWRGALGARLLMFEERLSALLAHRVVAVHELHRRRLEAAGVAPEKIRVVLNSPDPAIFAAGEISSGARRGGGAFTLVCHGMISHRLGLDVALRAVQRLRFRIPGLRLRIAGGGEYVLALRRTVERLRLEAWTEFVDRVPLDELPSVLRGAAVGLVPNHASSATHLMLPVKLLEYAMLGIPVIAARLRTIEHYFDPDAVEFFTPDDACDLARAIDRLYREPKRRAQLARNACGVAERLGWAAQRSSFYDAIDSLLREPTERALPTRLGREDVVDASRN